MDPAPEAIRSDAVRKSEGIAKICGEPPGGCAKLNSVTEIGFYFADNNHTNDQQTIYG